MASVHDGHRARMRDKIRKGGLGSFQQHEILEYLLFSFVPRKDTNEIAHALIDKFSSLSGVLNASEEDLEKVSGMTQNAALDAHDKLIKCEIIEQGSGDSVRLDVRKIVDFALKTGASAILIAHNHPSGNLLPSQKDVNMTQEAMTTLSGIGVELQDHLIFSGSEYYSFEERGTMEKIKNIQEGLKEGIAFYE